MIKRKVTINVPVELIDTLKEMGVANFASFLESLLGEVEPEDLLDLLEQEEDDYWDEDDDLEDDDF